MCTVVQSDLNKVETPVIPGAGLIVEGKDFLSKVPVCSRANKMLKCCNKKSFR